jgi:hypothetical protein
MSKTIWRVGLMLGGLLLGAGGGELVARKLMGQGGGWYDAAALEQTLREQKGRLGTALPMPGEAAADGERQAKDRLVVHPYLGYDFPSTAMQLGYELEQYSAHDPERLRVLLLGGSVAGIFGRLGGQRLIANLEASPVLGGRKVDLMQYGRGGFKQPQHLLRTAQLFAFGVKPDLVINLDGFNEVALGTNNTSAGMYPGYPSFSHWLPLVSSSDERGELIDAYAEVRGASRRYEAALDDLIASPLRKSAAYALLEMRRIARLQATQGQAREAYFAMIESAELEPSLLGPKYEGTRAEVVQLAARLWMEASLQLKKLCDANDAAYLQILQPTLWDKGAKPVTAVEREKCELPKHWESGVFHGSPMLRQGGKMLQGQGVDFVDASRIFAEVEDTLYYDACHFGRKGNEMLADLMAERALELLARRQ